MTASIKNQIINEFDREINSVTAAISGGRPDDIVISRLKAKRDTLEDIKSPLVNWDSNVIEKIIDQIYQDVSVSMVNGDIGHNSGVMCAMEILSHYR